MPIYMYHAGRPISPIPAQTMHTKIVGELSSESAIEFKLPVILGSDDAASVGL